MNRIGMFTYSTEPRGSVVHAVCLSEALAAAGQDVTLFALSKSQRRFWRDVACHVRLIPAAEAPPALDALIAQRIAELARGLASLAPAFDVLHAQDCLVAGALLEARRRQPALSRCPIVRTVHHVEQFDSPYLSECQRRSVLDVDIVLSVSDKTADDVQREFGRASQRVNNGVHLARFDPGFAPPRAALHAELGLPSDAFVVLSVGGVEPRKNSRRCLAAVARVLLRTPSAYWIIAGGPGVLDHCAYQAAFEAELAQLPVDVQRRIVRTGALAEKRLTDLYRTSDVLLGASEHEGFGLSVLEGMAAELPVVVPNRPPFIEYVPAHAAVFVDPESVDDIARGVELLERDRSLCAELGALGPSVAREFSWERSAEQHARLYGRAQPL